MALAQQHSANEPSVQGPGSITTSFEKDATFRVIPRRSFFPWILAAGALAITATFVTGLLGNDALDWSQTVKYLFSPQVLRGVWVTIQLSIYSMFLGILIGLLIGLGRMSHNKVLSALAGIYITIFRSIPVLLQLLIWGNIGLIAQNLTVGIPFTDIAFFSVQTNQLISPFTAAILGLALAEAAYIAEVVRAGVMSVDRGQIEAASTLGMTPLRTTRRVVLPQALRLIVPPLGNQFVTLIKATSLVSVIAGGDLLTQAQNISASNYRVIELLAVAAFWYLVIVSIASIGQYFLERNLGKGQIR